MAGIRFGSETFNSEIVHNILCQESLEKCTKGLLQKMISRSGWFSGKIGITIMGDKKIKLTDRKLDINKKNNCNFGSNIKLEI